MKKLGKAVKAIILVAVYLGIYFAVSFLVQFAYVYWNKSSGTFTMAEIIRNATGNSYALSVISMVITFWVYLIIGKVRGISQNEISQNKKWPPIISVMALCLAIGMRLLVTVYYSYSQHVEVLRKSIEDSEKAVPEVIGLTQLLIAVFATIIIAPMFEEFLFRGLIMHELTMTVRPWLAILIQATLFGLAHGALFQSLFTFVIGVLLGIVYYRTKSLKITTICHGTFNCSAILAQDNLTLRTGVMVAVMGVVLVIFSMLYILKYCKRQ